jgi:hypothetical protein
LVAQWYQGKLETFLELYAAPGTTCISWTVESKKQMCDVDTTCKRLLKKTSDALEKTVWWFLERHDRFLEWIPENDEGNGEWRVRFGAVGDALRHEVFLEKWLSDLHCGSLRAESAPRESFYSRAWFLVKDPYYFVEKRRERLRNWPIACRDCGEHFKPVENPNYVRCPECRKARRRARP